MQFFDWLEHSDFSMWIKDPETLFGYNLYLSAHAIGMAILVGLSAAVALRILGFASSLPLKPMEKFFPVMFAGFWINAISGVVLFAIYPLKPIGNPGFYVKIGLVIAAVLCLRRIRREVFRDPACAGTDPVPASGRRLAGALLAIWLGVITAGRLMAYHGIANVERQVSIAILVVVCGMLLGGWFAYRLRDPNPPPRIGR
jgi:hypothetical protein